MPPFWWGATFLCFLDFSWLISGNFLGLIYIIISCDSWYMLSFLVYDMLYHLLCLICVIISCAYGMCYHFPCLNLVCVIDTSYRFLYVVVFRSSYVDFREFCCLSIHVIDSICLWFSRFHRLISGFVIFWISNWWFLDFICFWLPFSVIGYFVFSDCRFDNRIVPNLLLMIFRYFLIIASIIRPCCYWCSSNFVIFPIYLFDK